MRGRRRDPGLVSPNLTPLLDVVLQLITFFMMLIHFGTRIEGETQAVRLPVAAAALPGGDLALDRLAVAIDAQGRLLAGGEAYDGSAAEAWWAEQARRRREAWEALGRSGEDWGTQVILRADREARYGAIRRAMAQAQARGFRRFSLVVLRRVER
ncbi:MAG: biopolymer transporter ExbD [Isosphaeraceae bacterium]|nr:biopolymer transporter ExbD [Isosphaeraceae bacterium]